MVFDGIPIPGATVESLLVYVDGNYALLTTNLYGCEDMSNEVGVYPTAGLLTNANAPIQVYPNPFNQLTTISFGQTVGKYDVILMNESGARVFEQFDVLEENFELCREGLSSGSYFLVIRDAESGRCIYFPDLIII